MDFVGRMEALARKWHGGQFRKGPEHRPYIVHPEAVVGQLRSWGYTEEAKPWVLAIAWGHDLAEDTAVPVGELFDACGTVGPEVLAGIAWLTFRRSHWPETATREKAKAMYIARVANEAPPDILAVKLADRFCNLRDFAELCGERTEKVQEYYREAECLFDNIDRLPAEIRVAVRRTLGEIRKLVFEESA